MPTPFPFVSGAVLTAANLNSITELPTRTLTSSGAAVAADAYSRVILNGTSITYTVNTSTFTAAQVVEIYNANSTTATIAAGAGITLNGAAGLTLAQYQTAQLYAVSATSFILWKSDASGFTNDSASVATSQSTSSTSYTDLATVGPTATVTTGTTAFVYIQAERADPIRALFSFAVSGDTTIAAGTYEMPASGSGGTGAVRSFEVTGLNAGSNTFTMKYKSDGTSQAFSQRTIFVVGTT